MTVARLSTSVAGASGVTFGLALLMQGLVVFHDEVDLAEENSWRFLDVIEDIPATDPEILDRVTLAPPPEPALPPPVTIEPGTVTGTPGTGWQPPTEPRPQEPLAKDIFGRLSDGDMLPIVRVQPDFPRRALANGIEGYAIVSLTVAADGSVDPASIVVVEAVPSGYFEASARTAAAKFKYKPKVVNGIAREVTGVHYKFTFGFGTD